MKLTCEIYGGEKGEQCNALMSAVENEASKQKVYPYEILDKPKTTLIAILVDSLNEIGYEIKSRKM